MQNNYNQPASGTPGYNAGTPGYPQGYAPAGQTYGAAGQPYGGSTQPYGASTPVTPVAPAAPAQKNKSLIEMIIIIVLGVVAATFIGLFIWMYIQYDDVKTDVDGQISSAVAIAVEENTTELQAQFTEQEKSPYETFTGPAEYGSLSFEYPKTWSVYIAEDSDDGGNYVAYFHPAYVYPVSRDQIYALRLEITSDSFDKITESYARDLEDGTLTMTVRQINGTSTNYYQGTLPDKHVGRSVIFRLRDKTVILQTDAELYAGDFETLLGTVTFNQ